MALTINTNIGSLVVKKDLYNATKALDKALKQAKIANCIKDIATVTATPQINKKLNTQLNAISVAQDNVAIGSSMLSTADINLNIISDNLEKIKTISKDTEAGKITTKEAISKIEQIWDDIDKIAIQTEFNGRKLFDDNNEGITLQIGTNLSDENKVTISAEILSDSQASKLTNCSKSDFVEFFNCQDYSAVHEKLENAITKVNTRKSNIDKLQNKFDYTADALDVKYANITSSMSTIKDADIVLSSADNIKSQILEQAAATLSSTANQIPSVAVNLM